MLTHDLRPGFNYDEIAAAYAAGVDNAPYNAHYERPATLALLPDVMGAHILDAGCGSGFYTEQLVQRGAHVTAVDGSSEMARHAERRLEKIGLLDPTGLTARTASVRNADLSRPLHFLDDASVDGIVAALVLHYLREWQPTLAEFRRVLKPDGWLLLSTHHPTTEAARFDTANYFETTELEDYWSWVGKVRFFRRPLTAIVGALTDAGFVIERLVEPLPDEIFRAERPESYTRLLRFPEFLLIRGRLAANAGTGANRKTEQP
jgi:SAM-dependent methyltransferase